MFESAPQMDPTQRKLEGLAFTFCKAATLVLIFQKYALLIVPLLACSSYIVAYVQGVRRSRCYLRFPLLIVAFWAVVVGLVAWQMFGSGPKVFQL